MPLILAIEPDRRQASKIVALAKSPLRAELIVAESTAKAFATLADRVPDLILTSLLLSPKDEHMLGDRLRELDAAGTKVQTLVIPVFATTVRRVRTSEGGLLTRLRRSKGKDAVPEGCDPEVFAEQITEYLDRAAAERLAAAVALEDELPIQQDPVYATRQEAQMAGASNIGDAAAREAAAREVAEWEAAAREAAAREAAAREAAAREKAAREQAALEQAAREAVAREKAAREQVAREQAAREQAAREAVAHEKAALEQAAREAAAREKAAREQAAREAAAREEFARAAAAQEAAAHEKAAREAAAREAAAREAAAREAAAREAAARSLVVPLDVDLAEFVAGIEAAAAAEKAAGRRRPLAAPDAPAIVASAPPQGEAPPAAPPAAEDPAAQPEWMQLLTAIKRDIEQLRTDHPEAGGESASQESSETPPTKSRSRSAGAKTRKKSTPPIQDEWGFFDPEQCGFAALLTKLDEITDQDEAPTKKPTRPRR